MLRWKNSWVPLIPLTFQAAALGLFSDLHAHKWLWQPCWRREIKLPIVRTLRAVTHLISLFLGSDLENSTKMKWRLTFPSDGQHFPLLGFQYWVRIWGRMGVLFSSTENKQCSKSGRSCLFVSYRCPCWSPRIVSSHSDPVICSLLPPHAPAFPLLSPSLCCFARSILLCGAAAALWRTSFHCIRNWYLNACELTVRSVCLRVVQVNNVWLLEQQSCWWMTNFSPTRRMKLSGK